MSVAEVQVTNKIFDLRSDLFDPGAIELLQIAALACPIHSYDPMDIAFLEANVDRPVIEVGESVVEYPVENNRLAYIHGWSLGKTILYAAKGAPETISQLCQFSSEQHDELISAVNLAADRGFRVLTVARSNT
jgi:Ca2+-transporting ATPase